MPRPETKTMNRIQELFERLYSEDTETDPAVLVAARWVSQDGYNLPRINRCYRYFRYGYNALAELTDPFTAENVAMAERLSGGAL